MLCCASCGSADADDLYGPRALGEEVDEPAMPPPPLPLLDEPTEALPLSGGIPGVPDVTSTKTALPIVGGTLLVTADGRFAVAMDPDRDRVFVVDLVEHRLAQTVVLDPGDAPARGAEGHPGRVHVAARGGDLVSIDVATGTLVSRQTACSAPRGVAYDAGSDELVVACQSGELVWLAGDGSAVVRHAFVEPDLRDVWIDDGSLWISRFRHAELLRLEGTAVSERRSPPTLEAAAGLPYEPHVARRLRGLPDGTVLMQHQHSNTGRLAAGSVYYGGGGCFGGVTQNALSVYDPNTRGFTTLGLLEGGFIADVAVSPDATEVAYVRPFGVNSVVSRAWLVRDASHPPSPCASIPGQTEALQGQATAVAYDPTGRLLVQTREPAALHVTGSSAIALSSDSRLDAGQVLFHLESRFGVTCASCHPEGGDDGTTWNFEEHGLRRTMSLGGGLLETAPFHWEGDRADMAALLMDTAVSRMGMPTPSLPQAQALGRFLDGIPAAAPLADRDAEAVARGAALFDRFQCRDCHSGPRYTNALTHDVGTGGSFQVPSLLGIANRAPYLHDGCAETLRDRFGPCGGDRHGDYADASEAELADLITFMTSL